MYDGFKLTDECEKRDDTFIIILNNLLLSFLNVIVYNILQSVQDRKFYTHT